jgi:type II secretory pathway pseudopilin PulG
MKKLQKKKRFKENGFSYIDVMIAIVIMLVGVLAMAGALTSNLIRTFETENKIVAKQLGLSTVESIIAARNINRPGTIEGWDSIGNKGNNIIEGNAKGVFVNGWAPIRKDLGWDGLAGTDDDACSAPGPCQVSGRPDNDSEVLNGFARKVLIEDVQDADRPSPPNPITRRKITVTIKYYIKKISREEEISTIVTNY